jgi:hypothetical protein
VYLILLLFCATTVAILVLVIIDVETPARGVAAQQRTPVPAAIR